MDAKILDALKEMERRGFKTHAFSTAEEMRDFVLNAIPQDATVGMGGSKTVDNALHFYELLKDRGTTVYFHAKVQPEEKHDTMVKANAADIYLMSSNAITYKGEILNVDAIGNRLAALAFGPKTVYILVGVNKFVPDKHAAIRRVREIAAPKNAAYPKKKTPCAYTGKCADCYSPDRICNATLWLDRLPSGGREFHICVADEELGY